MSDTSTAQRLTLERFLNAWRRWSAADQLATFADDFTQVTLPASLGVPNRSRQQVEIMLPALVAIVKSFKVWQPSMDD